MTESYNSGMQKSNGYSRDIVIAIITAGITTFMWFAQDWLTNKVEMGTVRERMEHVIEQNEKLYVKLDRFYQDLEDIKRSLSAMPKIEERVADVESRLKMLEADTKALETVNQNQNNRLDAIKEKEEFYHGPGKDKDRRTIEEWREEFERRERQKNKHRGKYDDSWDGQFPENQNWNDKQGY